MITDSAIINQTIQDEYSTYGQKRDAASMAASYGRDVRRMLAANGELDEYIALYARIAARFGLIAELGWQWQASKTEIR